MFVYQLIRRLHVLLYVASSKYLQIYILLLSLKAKLFRFFAYLPNKNTFYILKIETKVKKNEY